MRVTQEADIAQFTRCNLLFRDGQLRRDEPVKDRLIPREVLKILPAIEDWPVYSVSVLRRPWMPSGGALWASAP